MALIRHKTTLVERRVPDRAVRYFPDYEVIKPQPVSKPAEKQARGRKPVEDDATTEE